MFFLRQNLVTFLIKKMFVSLLFLGNLFFSKKNIGGVEGEVNKFYLNRPTRGPKNFAQNVPFLGGVGDIFPYICFLEQRGF